MTIGSVELPVPDGLRFTFEIVDRIVRNSGRVSHTFMEEEEFREICRSDSAMASKIYWYELLARAHIGAHLSLSRTSTWLSAVDIAWRAANVLLYAAAMRGLLESRADSWFTFRFVPMTLANHHYHTLRAIRGKSKRVAVMPEIEDALIHFTHARRLQKEKKGEAPKSHEAMTIQNYLRSLDADYEKAAVLYERLCSLTHPSAESLAPFIGDSTRSTWRLTQRDQKQIAKDLHAAFYDVFSDILIKALNLPLTLLKLLNTFKEPSLFTPTMGAAEARNIPIWPKIQRAIERSARTPTVLGHRNRKGLEKERQ
jgi:hypothetical protein